MQYGQRDVEGVMAAVTAFDISGNGTCEWLMDRVKDYSREDDVFDLVSLGSRLIAAQGIADETRRTMLALIRPSCRVRLTIDEATILKQIRADDAWQTSTCRRPHHTILISLH